MFLIIENQFESDSYFYYKQYLRFKKEWLRKLVFG